VKRIRKPHAFIESGPGEKRRRGPNLWFRARKRVLASP
jgi:hypothetical protein